MDDFRKAWNNWDSYERITALRNVTEPSILAFVSKNDPDWRVRRAAVENITDQDLLAEFAKNDLECGVRFTAARRLDDKALAQEVYAALADNTANHRDIRTKACAKLDGGHKWLGCKCRRCGAGNHVWENKVNLFSKDLFGISGTGGSSKDQVCRKCGMRKDKLSDVWSPD